MEIYKDEKRAIDLTYNGVVSIVGNKKIHPIHVSRLRLIPMSAEVATKVRKMGEDPTTRFMIGSEYGPWACVPIPVWEAIKPHAEAWQEKNKKENDEREAKFTALKNSVLAACPSDCIPCSQNWSNGDLMSGEYQAEDGTKIIASDLMDGHQCGIYYIPRDKYEKAYIEQTQAAAEKTAMKKAETDRQAAIFTEAKNTGKPVVLNTWITNDCTEHLQDCSFDTAIKYAMPDGTTKIKYTHCY